MDYGKLKSIIKACAEIESKGKIRGRRGGHESGGDNRSYSNKEERTTSLSMVPYPPSLGKLGGEGGDDVSEADFFALVDSEISKVSAFTKSAVKSLRKRAETLVNESETLGESVISDGENDAKRLETEAKSIGEKFLQLEKFVNLNVMGFSKILKKHDKLLPTTPSRTYYMAQLRRQNWIQRNYGVVFELLGRVYTNLRGEERVQSSSSSLFTTAGLGLYKTARFWVRTADISRVKHILLQHLPVSQPHSDEGEADCRDFRASSVYLDSSELSLYHSCLSGFEHGSDDGSAMTIRIKWYGSKEPEKVYVERKIHKSMFGAEYSQKERTALRSSDVVPFLRGTLGACRRLPDAARRTGGEGSREQMDRIFEDLQQSIDVKQLRPVIRTDYVRTVYKRGNDRTVSVAFDTNIVISKEDTKMRGGRWHRPSHVQTKSTQVPYAVIEIRLARDLQNTPPEDSGDSDNDSSSNEVSSNDASSMKPPAWVLGLIGSGLLTEVRGFSKFTHGCAMLLHEDCREFPYWTHDDEIKASSPPRRPSYDRPFHGAGDAEEEGEGAPLLARSLKHPSKGGYGSVKKASVSVAPSGSAMMRRKHYSDGSFLDWLSWPVLKLVSCLQFGTADPGDRTQKLEPKVLMANERIFLQWMHMSVTMGTTSSVVLGLGGHLAAAGGNSAHSKLIGLVTLPLSVIFALYALHIFHWRGRQIYSRRSNSFGDTNGPIILGVALAATLTSILAVNVL